MHRRNLLFSLAIIICWCPPAGFTQGKPPKGEKFALLVGVHEYDPTEFRNLPYAEEDVTALTEVLKTNGYAPENTVLMTISRKKARFLPLAANIRKELKLLLERHAGPDRQPHLHAAHGEWRQPRSGRRGLPARRRVLGRNRRRRRSRLARNGAELLRRDVAGSGRGTMMFQAEFE